MVEIPLKDFKWSKDILMILYGRNADKVQTTVESSFIRSYT